MAEEARWSMSFCWVREGGRFVVGVVVPDRRAWLSRDGVTVPATLGIDLLRFAWSKSPPVAGELREGRKLLPSFGVPADPSPSINRDTTSLPGVSNRVEPALWLRMRASCESDTTVASIEDIWGGAL